jgi:hypothetical protein
MDSTQMIRNLKKHGELSARPLHSTCCAQKVQSKELLMASQPEKTQRTGAASDEHAHALPDCVQELQKAALLKDGLRHGDSYSCATCSAPNAGRCLVGVEGSPFPCSGGPVDQSTPVCHRNPMVEAGGSSSGRAMSRALHEAGLSDKICSASQQDLLSLCFNAAMRAASLPEAIDEGVTLFHHKELSSGSLSSSGAWRGRSGHQEAGLSELHIPTLSRNDTQLSVRSGTTTASPTPRQHISATSPRTCQQTLASGSATSSSTPQQLASGPTASTRQDEPSGHSKPRASLSCGRDEELLSLLNGKVADNSFAVPPLDTCASPKRFLFMKDSMDINSHSAPLLGSRAPVTLHEALPERADHCSSTRMRPEVSRLSLNQDRAAQHRHEMAAAVIHKVLPMPSSPLFESFTFPLSRNFFFSDGSHIHVQLPGATGGD